jgi:hypothetical protein
MSTITTVPRELAARETLRRRGTHVARTDDGDLV